MKLRNCCVTQTQFSLHIDSTSDTSLTCFRYLCYRLHHNIKVQIPFNVSTTLKRGLFNDIFTAFWGQGAAFSIYGIRQNIDSYCKIA